MHRKHSRNRGTTQAVDRLSKAVLATGIAFMLGDAAAKAQTPVYKNTNTTSQVGYTYNSTEAISAGSAGVVGLGAWDTLYTVNTAATTQATNPYWKITSTSVGVYNSGSARTDTVQLKLWGGVNTSTASGQIVTNQLGTWSTTQTLAAGYNNVKIATPNAWYTPSALGTGTPIGVQVTTLTAVSAGLAYDGGAGIELVKAAPTVGSQVTNGFYGLSNIGYFASLGSTFATPNAFHNGVGSYFIGTSSLGFPYFATSGAFEANSAANEYAFLQLNGSAVPAPPAATIFGGLGLPAFGLLRRRRAQFMARRRAEAQEEASKLALGHMPDRPPINTHACRRRC